MVGYYLFKKNSLNPIYRNSINITEIKCVIMPFFDTLYFTSQQANWNISFPHLVTYAILSD